MFQHNDKEYIFPYIVPVPITYNGQSWVCITRGILYVDSFYQDRHSVDHLLHKTFYIKRMLQSCSKYMCKTENIPHTSYCTLYFSKIGLIIPPSFYSQHLYKIWINISIHFGRNWSFSYGKFLPKGYIVKF